MKCIIIQNEYPLSAFHIDRKVGLDSEITVSCYLHLCLSVFHAFLIMFIAQSVRSHLNSSATVDSSFWSYERLLLHILFGGFFTGWVGSLKTTIVTRTYRDATARRRARRAQVFSLLA